MTIPSMDKFHLAQFVEVILILINFIDMLIKETTMGESIMKDIQMSMIESVKLSRLISATARSRMIILPVTVKKNIIGSTLLIRKLIRLTLLVLLLELTSDLII